MKELINSKVMNPVMILDEIDKLETNTYAGNPYDSLLEILNHEENHSFNDHYLDFKVDFS